MGSRRDTIRVTNHQGILSTFAGAARKQIHMSTQILVYVIVILPVRVSFTACPSTRSASYLVIENLRINCS